jgi:uncharacterized protein (TIGR02594 family)
MNITLIDIAQRFIGVKEVPGKGDNAMILAMLRLDGDWPEHDEVPWCSAYLNFCCWLLRLPRSKSLAARSWLGVGRPVALADARWGFDLVVLKRGGANQPGPEVLDAQGHVGVYVGHSPTQVMVLGGNQADTVSVVGCPHERVLGVRSLWNG